MTPQVSKVLKDSTLIYLFYNSSDFEHQKLAAIHLCDKGWVYDKKEKTWIFNMAKQGEDKNVYYFDINEWDKKVLTEPVNKNEIIGKKEFQNN